MREKRIRTIATVIQGFLIIMMTILVVSMIYQIKYLQGTARVVNYAGLVRGATQREVKLEIAGEKNDELIAYLDEIILGLRDGSSKYHLVSLKDNAYQKDLGEQIDYWQKLKSEIYLVRENGYEDTNIVAMSEQYFKMADKTVFAAENYSESIAKVISYLEVGTIAVIVLLLLIMLGRSIEAVAIRHKNKQLEQKAFIDQHTGLPNKGKCEEFFYDESIMKRNVGCIVFDLNNLKLANDTLGHTAGDKLIANFARLLRNSVPEKHFVGRYGGDEFMSVIYDSSKNEIEKILETLRKSTEEFNEAHQGEKEFVAVNYACGWIVSDKVPVCTFRELFDMADKNMYENKMKKKRNHMG